MRDWPHTRSIKAVEHLARWRGASVGAEAAEASLAEEHSDHPVMKRDEEELEESSEDRSMTAQQAGEVIIQAKDGAA